MAPQQVTALSCIAPQPLWTFSKQGVAGFEFGGFHSVPFRFVAVIHFKAERLSVLEPERKCDSFFLAVASSYLQLSYVALSAKPLLWPFLFSTVPISTPLLSGARKQIYHLSNARPSACNLKCNSRSALSQACPNVANQRFWD